MDQPLAIGDLVFQVKRSRRRKSIGITVDRDGTLLVHAPVDVSDVQLRELVESRMLWVHTKLAEKNKLRSDRPPRRYVGGESHPYLGRHYRLAFSSDASELQLVENQFVLPKHGEPEDLFREWYRARGQEWLEPRVADHATRVDAHPKGIDVRELGNRWASCRSNGTLQFHWRVIQLPALLIDYVIVHELVHLHEAHHTPVFWGLMRRAMPDFEKRKAELAKLGGDL